jgi:hypothetical protein
MYCIILLFIFLCLLFVDIIQGEKEKRKSNLFVEEVYKANQRLYKVNW